MIHECGLAREYPIFGVYESEYTWEKGDRILTTTMDDL